MLLNDIGKAPDTTFKRINQHLETNYGFKISEDVSDRDLVVIMEQIQDEITELKIKGDDSKASPEISKRLLVLEGMRSLREFAMSKFQSPDLDMVIDGLTKFVIDTFRLTGENPTHYERAVEGAMGHYRSSKYRFADNIIEQRVRSKSLPVCMNSQGSGAPELNMAGPDVFEADADWSQIGKRDGSAPATAPSSPQGLLAMKALDAPELSLAPQSGDKAVPMVRDKTTGRMVADPFAAQAARKQGQAYNESTEQQKGVKMKEHATLVKNLRRLLETEVSQAEVMMAAKGFAQELQEMVEKIGRLQNEDLPPVTDQMRETYGMESASAFQTQIYGALQGVMDSLYTAKNQVDDAVSNMAATGQFNAPSDMDLPVDGMDAGMGDPNAMDAEDDFGGDDMDLDNIDAELDAEDDFGGEEPLGRSKKMESAKLQKRILEMKKLVEKAKKIREARSA